MVVEGGWGRFGDVDPDPPVGCGVRLRGRLMSASRDNPKTRGSAGESGRRTTRPNLVTELPAEFEIFTTLDEGKAKDALGKVFVVGGGPHRATTVEVDYGKRWVVKGIVEDPLVQTPGLTELSRRPGPSWIWKAAD